MSGKSFWTGVEMEEANGFCGKRMEKLLIKLLFVESFCLENLWNNVEISQLIEPNRER